MLKENGKKKLLFSENVSGTVRTSRPTQISELHFVSYLLKCTAYVGAVELLRPVKEIRDQPASTESSTAPLKPWIKW